DWHPRESKRGGAWMNYLITGGPRSDGSRAPHLGLICGNMTPPVEGRPALLTHREVETVFHEFGHLLHHLLTEVETASLAGTNVAWDFVELPSQIHENWAWEREALDLFAKHHATGDTIPEPLYGAMRRARTFRGATQQMRQLGFADLDLRLHRVYEPTRDGELLAYARSVAQAYAATTLPDPYPMICGFTHLFAHAVGYGAGYYSYKWAEVLDADAFSVFAKNGIFDPATGEKFRSTILARGDAADPMELFVAFAGREPKLDALLGPMRRARTFRAAAAMMRQLGLCDVDLSLHTRYDASRDGDVLAYARGVMQRYAPAPLPDDYAMITGFGHLFAHPVGYAAGYYSYKWAEVLDADAYDRFANEGVFNRETGDAFRRSVLEHGDSRDPMALFREFRGRDPDVQPLLRRSGLI
ncbi:MAG: hypothetical protein IAG13_38500, partial [Deltaproteobacteria bacterium]|nr:hypothetical protein [Nannocystaceae bacterium]